MHHTQPTPSVDAVYGTPIWRLLQKDEHELRQLQCKAEAASLWLRGILAIKTRMNGAMQ